MRFTGFPSLTRFLGLIAFLAAMLSWPASASADMILSLVPVNPTVSAGSTDNVLELQLVNTGPDPLNVASTSFDIKTDNANIVFTSATTATSALYIFPSSLFGPTISVTAGQEITGNDLDATGSGRLGRQHACRHCGNLLQRARGGSARLVHRLLSRFRRHCPGRHQQQ